MNQQLNDAENALARAGRVSQALADAARRVRLSRRTRGKLVGGGFQARKGQRAYRIFMALSFFFIVAIPVLVAGIYYGFIATNQYVAEAQFTVMGGEIQSNDGFGTATGIPVMAIIQDTQIVANYILSRSAIDEINKTGTLTAAYSKNEIDWLSRLNKNASIEKLVKYWQRMVTVSIKMPSGILEVEVRAFSPKEAADICQAVIGISEKLINDLNFRINTDMVQNTQKELDAASSRLTSTRINLEKARNDSGILDAERTGELLTKLITEARSSLLNLQQERATQLKYVKDSAPQMQVLSSRIEAARQQIRELEEKLTTSEKATSRNNSASLSGSMTRFAALDLEKQIAERLYAGAAAAFEIAKIAAERKVMYLNTFVWPVIPQDYTYPKRGLMITLVTFLALAGWGILAGLVTVARNYMA